MRRGQGVSLVRFGFVSRPCAGLPEAAIRRLARDCTERNRRTGLTGVLSLLDGKFQQVIEGPCDVVMVLASDILVDQRYERIRVTGFHEIKKRSYADWQVIGIDDSSEFCLLQDHATAPLPDAGGREVVQTCPDAHPRAKPAFDGRA